jgi:hypothetical protein
MLRDFQTGPSDFIQSEVTWAGVVLGCAPQSALRFGGPPWSAFEGCLLQDGRVG